jgi:hypothetical protein
MFSGPCLIGTSTPCDVRPQHIEQVKAISLTRASCPIAHTHTITTQLIHTIHVHTGLGVHTDGCHCTASQRYILLRFFSSVFLLLDLIVLRLVLGIVAYTLAITLTAARLLERVRMGKFGNDDRCAALAMCISGLFLAALILHLANPGMLISYVIRSNICLYFRQPTTLPPQASHSSTSWRKVFTALSGQSIQSELDSCVILINFSGHLGYQSSSL